MKQYRINLKNLATIVACFAVFASCDTGYDIFYDVENLTNETVRIEARYKSHLGPEEKECSFSLAPGETARVYSDGGLNAKNYVPADEHAFPPQNKELPPFEKFEVYVGDVQLPEHIRHREYWEYSAKKLLGVYTLRITDELKIDD
jgi:hypothetical protein